MRTGEYTRSTTDFYAGIEKAGLIRKKKKSGMWVQGVQVKNDGSCQDSCHKKYTQIDSSF